MKKQKKVRCNSNLKLHNPRSKSCKVRCNSNLKLHNPRSKSCKVMVFGTFDRLHKGHEYFLREAKKRGSFLVVVVARDATVMDVKGRMPDGNEMERKRDVEGTGIPDRVLLGSLDDKYEIIRKEKPDLICLGYDQKFFVGGLEDEMKAAGLGAEIMRIAAYMPEKYKTSLMKKEK